MAIVWKLGKFIDGSITRDEPLPVKDAGSSISIDINGEDETELAIAKSGLTPFEANNWQDVFQPITSILIAVDTDKEWDDPFVVPFVGFVNKISDQIQDGVINVQLTSLNEYTKARIVADNWGTITDPTTEVTFSGDSWTSVMVNIINSCFNREGIPAGKPMPPLSIGNLPSYNDGAVKKTVRVADAKTYYDVLQEVKNDNSGTGLEYRFVPRFLTAAMTHVVWDVIVGTSANPHIGEETTIELELSDNDAKFSKFSATIDSNSVFSKMYIQSKAGDEETKDGADFTQASVDADKFPILIERFMNPGVELTEAELQAQLTSRLKYSIENSFETSFTLEEKADIREWLGRLGSIITVTGIDDTISAGHSAKVRMVGLTWTPGKNSVSVDVMQLQPSYPRLPKDRVKDLLNGGSNQGNSSPIPTGFGGGGLGGGGGGGGGGVIVPPTPPITTPSLPGVMLPEDMFGDMPSYPGATFPPAVKQTLGFENYIESSQIIENWLGETPFHPWSAVAGIGNYIHALDKVSVNFNSTYDANGNPVHGKDGGINPNTGQPLSGGIPSFYIKKTYMADGILGTVEEAGVIPSETIIKAMNTWENIGVSHENMVYSRDIIVSNVVIKDRFVIIVGNKDLQVYNRSNGPLTRYSASKAIVFSSSYNEETGMIGNEWKEEGVWDTEKSNYTFPMTPNIAKNGNNTYIFGGLYFDTTIRKSMTVAGIEVPFIGEFEGQGYRWWLMEQGYDDGFASPAVDFGAFTIGSFINIPAYGGLQTNFIHGNREPVIRLFDMGYDFANHELPKSWGQVRTGTTFGKHIYTSYGINPRLPLERKAISASGEILNDDFKEILKAGNNTYNGYGMLATVGGNMVFFACGDNRSDYRVSVAYNRYDSSSSLNSKYIPQEEANNYGSFLFGKSSFDTINHVNGWGVPIMEENPYGVDVYGWVSSRIFTWDDTVYVFQLQMNDEGTKRNKLACHSLHAYDPSI